MAGTKTYFVSDVHLGLDVKDPAGRERRFVAFLRGLDDAAALYLLGDIWDFWYEYRDVVPKGYVQVFAALQALIARGVKVCFFPGNHDIWAYRYFAEMGITVLEQPYMTEIGGLTVCMGHGDGLGPGQRGYKFMRRGFHSRVLQWLFSTFVPVRWAFRLGTTWSRHSRLAKNLPYTFRGADEPLYQYALKASQERHIDLFIFGHYHTKVDLTLPTGARLIILKDWMDGSDWFSL